MFTVKKTVYFSPQPSDLISNEYISSFNDALKKYFTVVNDHDKFRPAVIKEFFASFKVDYFILNWPEDIVTKKGGFIQLWLGFLSVHFLKLTGGKLVWICHNKTPRGDRYKGVRLHALNWYVKHADLILTHAKEAVVHLRDMQHCKGELIYFPHPPYPEENGGSEQTRDIDSDILIWGNISPYKGILEFIQEYKKRNCTYTVCIIGKCNNLVYFQQLTDAAIGLPIRLQNSFPSDLQLKMCFEKTRMILLPYKEETIYASGSLIHSLMSEKIIVGPETGNFKDLQELGICFTYSDYDDMFLLFDKYLKDCNLYKTTVSQIKKSICLYRQEYSWNKFAETLHAHL